MIAIDLLWLFVEQGREALVSLLPAAESLADAPLPVALVEVSVSVAVLRDMLRQRVGAARGFLARRDASWWSAVWEELSSEDAPRRLVRGAHRTLSRLLG